MFSFTNRQLEVLLAICASGSFRKAADALRISQAGVSNHIRALEFQLGHRLFERQRGASNRLTAAGQIFKTQAEQFVDSGRALGKLSFQSVVDFQPVSLFVGRYLFDEHIRPALPNLSCAHPDIDLQFGPEEFRDRLSEKLLRGDLDCAVLAAPPGFTPPQAIVLADLEIGLFATPQLLQQFSDDGLDDLPIILIDSSAGQTDDTIKSLNILGIQNPRIVAKVHHHEVALSMASRGIGALLCFKNIIAKKNYDKKLVCIRSISGWSIVIGFNPKMPAPRRSLLENFLRDALKGLISKSQLQTESC